MSKPTLAARLVKPAEMMLGITLTSMGSTLGIIAGMGQTTTTSLFSAVGGALGIKVGSGMLVVYLVFMLLQLPLLNGRGRMLVILQLLPTFIKTYVTNFFRYDFAPFQRIAPDTYAEQFLVFAAGSVLISLGFAAGRCAEFLNFPPESFCTVLSQRLGIRYGTGKIIMDAVYVGSALTICLLTGQSLGIVREGTLIFALVNGPTINFVMPYVKRLYTAVELRLGVKQPV